MRKSNFTRTEPNEWNLFVQKCKIVYQMLISKQFVLINSVNNEETKTARMEVVGFGMSMQEVSNTTQKAYIESINVSYRDASLAHKLIKQLHGHDNLTLAN